MSAKAEVSRPERLALLSRRVILVTGKGGVGRTTTTAALARACARAGRRVLIAEIGDPESGWSPLARLYGREQLPEDPTPLERGVDGCVLWATKGHGMFAEKMLPVGALARAAMKSKALERLLDAAPSFQEMGVFYHFLGLVKQQRSGGAPMWDTMIVDMPATGHTLALTGLPTVLLRLMPTGPIAELLREGQAYLNNPKQTACFVVTLPETLPVTEALELIDGLRETNMHVGAVVVNKVVEDVFSPQERAWLAERLQGRAVFGATRFLTMAEIERSMERLRRSVGVPAWQIPEFGSMGDALIQDVSNALLPGGAP
jgi:anion-transporting  ArsA/GET3 family ATPase